MHDYFQMDEGIRKVPLNNYFYPEYEPQVLEDHGDWHILRDERGVARREPKDKTSLPAYVDWPVHSRQDFQRLVEERLRPTLAGRLPENWPELVEEFKHRDYPLAIGGGQGFFGTLRHLLGLEKLLLAYYDEPELVKEINEYLTDFWIAVYDPVLSQVKPDLALIWEDMCYKTGSLISPAAFREFMLPYYKRLTSFFRDHGIQVILVDTDGNHTELTPLFLEGGVTGLYPFEVNAGMDVVEARRNFPRLHILGGVDKTKLSAGKQEIDAELDARLPFMLRRGGYVPTVDHLVPPDIPWANFVHYRQQVAQLIGEGGTGATE